MLASVNNIGTALESLHEAAERGIEYSTHQQRESLACKLIV
jgi:Iap family predicted aminopeptidase